MKYEKDEVWGTPVRRPLTRTRVLPDVPTQEDIQAGYARATDSYAHPVNDANAFAFGPEAHERAQEMAYDRITRIQMESPYTATDVVEHVVHDQRLYMGMWIVAGVGAVSAFLSYSLPCLLVSAVAVAFALYCSPGRQVRSEKTTKILD